MKEPPVIFISGSGRSGTNVTKAILGAHSKCAALPFEYRFTIDPGGIIDFYNSYSSIWSPFLAEKKIKNLEQFLLNLSSQNFKDYSISKLIKKIDKKGTSLTPYPYAGWELDKWMPGYSSFVENLISNLTSFSYSANWPGSDPLVRNHMMKFGKPLNKKELKPILSQFLHQCIISFLKKENKKVFVEDNTWSILFADDLLNLIPQGRFLHIVRDPRDVIASLIQQRWTPNTLDDTILYYKSIMDAWSKKKALLSSDKYLDIRLEDLIDNPTKTINAICNFSGLEFEPSMIETDLTKSNTGRHKEAFSKREIANIEKELKSVFQAYNYSI